MRVIEVKLKKDAPFSTNEGAKVGIREFEGDFDGVNQGDVVLVDDEFGSFPAAGVYSVGDGFAEIFEPSIDENPDEAVAKLVVVQDDVDLGLPKTTYYIEGGSADARGFGQRGQTFETAEEAHEELTRIDEEESNIPGGAIEGLWVMGVDKDGNATCHHFDGTIEPATTGGYHIS